MSPMEKLLKSEQPLSTNLYLRIKRDFVANGKHMTTTLQIPLFAPTMYAHLGYGLEIACWPLPVFPLEFLLHLFFIDMGHGYARRPRQAFSVFTCNKI